jgi:hypothetical protein
MRKVPRPQFILSCEFSFVISVVQQSDRLLGFYEREWKHVGYSSFEYLYSSYVFVAVLNILALTFICCWCKYRSGTIKMHVFCMLRNICDLYVVEEIYFKCADFLYFSILLFFLTLG